MNDAKIKQQFCLKAEALFFLFKTYCMFRYLYNKIFRGHEHFVKVTPSAGSDLQLKKKKKQCLGVTDAVTFRRNFMDKK